MKRLLLIGILLGAAVACGGGGGQSGGMPHSPVVGPNSASRTAALTIVVPSLGAASGAVKRPKLIVPGTQSVRIVVYTVNGATPSPQPPDTIAQISATAPGCSTISTGISCTIDVGVPISNAVVLEILSYSSTNASGTPIGQGFVGPINTTVAVTTPVGVSLGGYIGSLAIGAITPQTPVGTTQTLTFTVTAKDGNGNLILPPAAYGTPITFSTTGDPNGALSLSPTSLSSPSATGTSTITITYNMAKALTGSPAINATAGTVTTGFSLGSGGGGLTTGYRIFEYAVPTANSHPWGIANGSGGGNIWFTENTANKFTKLFINTCTQVAPFTCQMLEGSTTEAIAPQGLTAAPDGNMWIGGTAPSVSSHIEVVEPTGTCASSTQTSLSACTVFEQTDPPSTLEVDDIKTGSDSLVHAAVTLSNGTGEIDSFFAASLPAAEYEGYNYSGSTPFALAANNWYTDPGLNEIGYVSCAEGCGTSNYGFVTLPNVGVARGIVVGPDNNVYIADQGNNAIQQTSTANCCKYNPYPLLTNAAMPEFLTVGPDGNIWFTESAANKIGILNLKTKLITEIAVPTANASPWGITLGPDGNIWFTEKNSNKIGVVTP